MKRGQLFCSWTRAQPKYFSRLDGKQNPDQVGRLGHYLKTFRRADLD
jgi:hypothetical protein